MEKQRCEESGKRREEEERRSEKNKSQKTEDAGARKGGKGLASAVQEICSAKVLGGQGVDFLEKSCILEHQIFLRDRCSILYDLASLFRGMCNTLDRWNGKIARRIGTRPSALHSTFHVWRKSRRIASFLVLSTSKIEQVSQNCFVFDVIKFKNWGSLAKLMLSKSKTEKSRRMASFSSLQIDR